MKVYRCDKCQNTYERGSEVPVVGFIKFAMQDVVRQGNSTFGKTCDIIEPKNLHFCEACEEEAGKNFSKWIKTDYLKSKLPPRFGIDWDDDGETMATHAWGGAGPDCITVLEGVQLLKQ